MHGFSPNLLCKFTLKGSIISPLWVNISLQAVVLNIYTSPELKPIKKFSPNLHHTIYPERINSLLLFAGVKLWTKSLPASWASSFQNLLARTNFNRPIANRKNMQFSVQIPQLYNYVIYISHLLLKL